MDSSARSIVAMLPTGPGVYRFRDARNRALYIGRSASLRSRVASYWGDLGDRPHLSAMVRRIDRVEVVSCDSEHEAAWLERNLLERQIPQWNVTAGGQEVAVCVKLDGSATAPGLSVLHTVGGPGSDGGLTADGAHPVWYFGPYLGGAKVRTAMAGLHRIFPLGYTADNQAGAAREMARQRGVSGSDRVELAQSLAAVLDRDPAAVADIRARLESRRDAASQAEAYELAGRIHAELVALDWITCPQRAASRQRLDADVAGWADGLLVRFEISGGHIRGWRQFARTNAQARPWLAATPAAWQDFADRNAVLAARLAGARLVPMS